MASFDTFGLDARLLRGLSKMNITTPTPVQLSVIPAALSGKDILASAKTGSGKTLAYVLPALSRLIHGSHVIFFH
jgi:superfamily II DNA/RNA helicase